MGKERVIAETGAGQHGVATATAAAALGLSCTVYMGSEDMRRQRLNVDRMRLLGAEVVPVDSGSRTLKDAINEALRDWVTNVRTTHYVLGSVLGPDPFPRMVRDFHRVIGDEARLQLQRQAGTEAPGPRRRLRRRRQQRDRPVHRLPRRPPGAADRRRGRRPGPRPAGEHAARFAGGALGVLHGTRTLVLQDEEGQIAPTHSVSAGLDYPAVGPEHVWLHDAGRVEYTSATDEEAIAAFHLLARTEGILPALESAHAIAEAVKRAPRLSRKRIILVNLSGRGDKDVESVLALGPRARGVLATWSPSRRSRCPAEERRDERHRRGLRQLRPRGAGRLHPLPHGGRPRPERHGRCYLEALAAGGADIIELGVPFSDPIADGPVNQRAAARALAAGTKLSGILQLVARHRDRLGVPIVLFTYFNPHPRPRRRALRRAGRGLRGGRRALRRPAAGGGRAGASSRPCATRGWTPSSCSRRPAPATG